MSRMRRCESCTTAFERRRVASIIHQPSLHYSLRLFCNYFMHYVCRLSQKYRYSFTSCQKTMATSSDNNCNYCYLCQLDLEHIQRTLIKFSEINLTGATIRISRFTKNFTYSSYSTVGILLSLHYHSG